MLSAFLGGLNVLQLMSEPMSVALNYGMFRRKEINGTVRHMMLYDMGASDTTVSIVAYQIVKTKEKGFAETHPQVQQEGGGSWGGYPNIGKSLMNSKFFWFMP